jgi:isoquinoline 1-oxidoreductase alpha subunit
MAASALLAKRKKPTEAEIEAAMADNLCRCGTYLKIKEAINRAAKIEQS